MKDEWEQEANNFALFYQNGKEKCLACCYSDENFWGYIECFKFNQAIAGVTTKDIAIREADAVRLNKDGNCEHFEQKTYSLKEKIKRFFCRLRGRKY